MSGINDFAFKMATVNGTGSASANSLLMQAIFRMGIPVTGKNIFPSNIQGLPTFYEVRVSKDGYTARPQHVDLVVALNPSTYAKDVATVRPGGYLVYDSSWPLESELEREGITILGIPFGRMCVDTFVGDRDRTLLRNIVYAGALAALLEIDMDIIGQMLLERCRKLAEGRGALDCRPEVHDAFNRRVDEANARMAWGHSSVNSWYKNARGRVSQNWPYGLIDYWRATLAPKPDEYVLEKTAEPVG